MMSSLTDKLIAYKCSGQGISKRIKLEGLVIWILSYVKIQKVWLDKEL